MTPKARELKRLAVESEERAEAAEHRGDSKAARRFHAAAEDYRREAYVMQRKAAQRTHNKEEADDRV